MISESHQRCVHIVEQQALQLLRENQSRSDLQPPSLHLGLSPAWNIKCYFYCGQAGGGARNRVMMAGSWEDISQIMWPELANTCAGCPGHNRLNANTRPAGGWWPDWEPPCLKVLTLPARLRSSRSEGSNITTILDWTWPEIWSSFVSHTVSIHQHWKEASHWVSADQSQVSTCNLLWEHWELLAVTLYIRAV